MDLRTAETERSWAAGFFDGEGCTYVQNIKMKRASGKQYEKKNLRMIIAQVQDGEVILGRFAKAVGGGYLNPKVKVGKRKDGTPCASQWWWIGQGEDVCTAVMEAMRPYLSEPKKVQFDRAYAAVKANFQERYDASENKETFLRHSESSKRFHSNKRAQKALAQGV